MITAEQVQKFALTFKGYEKAHGRYKVTRTNEDKNKREGIARTVLTPISYSTWEDHLTGKTGEGLGVIMLQENNTCRFGAIDIDDPTIDHSRLSNTIESKHLPLVVCRSKSGGAHCYVFFKTDCPAKLLREKLDEWRSVLGLSKKTETFPKQISRATPEETGNWINLPYYNAERTDRFAVDGSNSLSLKAFLELAATKMVSPDDLRRVVMVPEPGADEAFFEGPPCLVAICQNQGFAEGSRNNGMYSVAVYLKKRYPDNWNSYMDRYNRLMANIPANELVQIVKSIGKKEYKYKCKEPPLIDFCNRRLCLKREYGIGDSSTTSAEYEITNMSRLEYLPPDPPMWTFEVNGRRVLVENDAIYSVDAMNRACMAQANCVPLNINMTQWRKILNKLIQTAEVVQMPSDASPTGQLWGRVVAFATESVTARSKDEVFTGQVYHEDGLAYFRSADLFAYLKQRGVRIQSEQYVWQLLKQHDAKSIFWNLKRAAGQVWCIPIQMILDNDEPEIVVQDEEF